MPTRSKPHRVDRDDYHADHYADWMRNATRSRLTCDQLDAARRQHRTTENLLSHIHELQMKEHVRIQKDFQRKTEQHHRRTPKLSDGPTAWKPHPQTRLLVTSPPPRPLAKHGLEDTGLARQEHPSHPAGNHPQAVTRLFSARAERLKANRDRFDRLSRLLD